MGTNLYERSAISAVRDYLVSLLTEEKWCEAQTVGEALKLLVLMKTAERGDEARGRERPQVLGTPNR